MSIFEKIVRLENNKKRYLQCYTLKVNRRVTIKTANFLD